MSTSAPPQPQAGAPRSAPGLLGASTEGGIPPVSRRRRVPPRVWIRRAHLWATLTLGILLLIVTTSAAAIVLEPEFNRLVHANLFLANPGQASIDLDTAVAAVKQAYPDHQFHYVTPPRRGDRYLIEIDHDDHPFVMFVDPVDGSLHGPFDRTAGVMGWLVRLHTTLFADATLLPVVGWPLAQVLLGVAAIVLLVMVCTGAVLWWPGVRRYFRNGFAVRLGRNAYTTHHDVYKVVGFVALAPLLLWGLTGANFEFYEQTRAAWYWVMPGEIPADPPAVVKGSTPGSGITAEDAVTRALAAAPGARLAAVVPPSEEANSYAVWLSRGIDSYEYFDWPGDFEVRVDPNSGEILGFAYTNYDTLASEIYEGWLFPTHAGTFAPWQLRMLWLVFGLAPLALALTGLRMWWLKRKGLLRRFDRRASLGPTATDGPGAGP